jgi:hypothetical protein
MSFENELQTVFTSAFKNFVPIYDMQILDYTSTSIESRYNESDVTCIINMPDITLNHQLIDVNLEEVIGVLNKVSRIRPSPREKPVIGLIKGVGSGKTRLLEEIRRKIIVENENILVLAITYNHFMTLLNVENFLEESSNLQSETVYALGILVRLAISFFGLKQKEAENSFQEILKFLSENNNEVEKMVTVDTIIRQFVLYLVKRSGRKIDKLFVLVDESMVTVNYFENKFNTKIFIA